MRGLVVVEHGPLTGASRLRDWLEIEGWDCTTVRLDRGEALPSPGEPVAVVVMGGFMSSNDDEGHPWLEEERRWIREVVWLGTPFLGVCLGAQLLARACGGAVSRMALPEIGSPLVSLTAAGESDPLFAALPPAFPGVEWHEDEVTALPPGAVHLARSDSCLVQAFRVGDSAWGVQFHPEADARTLRAWEQATGTPYPDPALFDEAACHTLVRRFSGLAAGRGAPAT